jgi:hypothetical protein
LKVTVPEATPAVDVTFEVKVTDCPKTDGLNDDTMVVVVAAGLTVCVRVVEVLLLKFEPPP